MCNTPCLCTSDAIVVEPRTGHFSVVCANSQWGATWRSRTLPGATAFHFVCGALRNYHAHLYVFAMARENTSSGPARLVAYHLGRSGVTVNDAHGNTRARTTLVQDVPSRT